MTKDITYDVAIAGGGLAGLALSIQCAREGYSVVLFEKEKYPFHKVCGEYVSLENWDFLEDLGLSLSEMDLPVIKNLLVTAPGGKKIETNLPLGGFGISRYLLDSELAAIARKKGVTILEETKVTDITFINDQFSIQTAGGVFYTKIAAGSFGKRSNLDIKWKRNFTEKKARRLNNYIGVKYHIKISWPADLIALHNFRNGYCGISKIENDKYCLCYLTTSNNLNECNNDIKEMENKILSKNPHLKEIFKQAEILFSNPVTISQISFDKKTQVENHVLMIGDAAGMITPLSGNGMSMALHGSKLAFLCIRKYLQNQVSREKMESRYQHDWQRHFYKRLRTGRRIQYFFGNSLLSDLLITALKPFPGITHKLISSTHGQPY
ncbi:MAG: FAD-binding protein [Bacteroidetes bacterium]|nr:FAD-binding protein [Bacteroidota bacterium]